MQPKSELDEEWDTILFLIGRYKRGYTGSREDFLD